MSHSYSFPVLELDELATPGAWEAATSDGGFQIEPDDEVGALAASLLEATRQFHAEDEAAKRRLAMNSGRRGYVDYSKGEDGSLTKGQSKYAMISLIDGAPEDSPYAGLFAGENQWPAWIPGWQDSVGEGMRRFQELALDIARGVARRGPDLLAATEGTFAQPLSTLRLLRYEPDSGAPLSFPAHSDLGGVTILIHEDISGLEVCGRDGTWRQVEASPGSITCMFGEMMQRLTNDRVIAPTHRVQASARKGGHSAVFFLDPALDAIVGPAGLEEGESPQYDPVKFGAYLYRRTFLDRLMKPARSQ